MQDLEHRASFAIIRTAPADGDTSESAIQHARVCCAAALRAHRKSGNRTQARWFLRHIYYLGYPMSRQQLEGDHHSHAAWLRRNPQFVHQ